jgi:hypothetical protein
MVIELTAEQAQDQTVRELAKVLRSHSNGHCLVGFRVFSDIGQCELQSPQPLRVLPSKLMMEQVESLLGQSKIKIHYHSEMTLH